MNLQEVLGTTRATGAAHERPARSVRMAPALEVLPGLWIRSLIAWPDGRRDTTTQVFWLQGPGFFADLRQPTGAPDFSRVHRLADVNDAQLAWMSTQEAFAGDLQFDGDVFEWDRAISLQPQGDSADRGRLVFEDRVLVERGEFGDYIEHWHRAREPRACGAARLLDEETGCIAYLIRADSLFMYARGRAAAGSARPPLNDGTTGSDGATLSDPTTGSDGATLSDPTTRSAGATLSDAAIRSDGATLNDATTRSAGAALNIPATRNGAARLNELATLNQVSTLAEAVRTAPTRHAARRLLDFEVAFGQVDDGTWRIERSSLPFRAGQHLAVASTSGFTLSLMDSHFDEGSRKRHWRIVDLRGDLQTVFYPASPRIP